MKFNYKLMFFVCIGSQLFAADPWRDSKFIEKMTTRYPAYKERIKEINNEVTIAFKAYEKDSKNEYAKATYKAKAKELANLICEISRREVNEQTKELSLKESQFEMIP
jgi:hypothetical protein